MVQYATFLDGLYVTVFGMAMVFVVLIALIYAIKLQTFLYNLLARKSTAKPDTFENAAIQPETSVLSPFEDSKLELTNVDERTAAIVIAIVCDRLKIPPERLYFKSIRRLESAEQNS